MSDNATLVERLRDPNYWGSIVREEAAARITELEAAVLAEREACARIAAKYDPHGTTPEATDIAASIRARPAP